MITRTKIETPFIVAYGKGGLELTPFRPDRDALIIMTDPGDPVPRIVSDPGLLPVLHLEISDINDELIPWFWKLVSDRCRSKETLQKVKKGLSKDWPTVPFTPLHAKAIIDFAVAIGFDRNIHVCCNYGRSRSVTVAQFMGNFLFPGYDLRISRVDSRINPRIHTILLKTLTNS
jgi:predicted protein tyrosine phosphatase